MEKSNLQYDQSDEEKKLKVSDEKHQTSDMKSSIQQRSFEDSSPQRLAESRKNGETNKRQLERQKALKEASLVLDSLGGGQTQLDSFHLLGVVADPRGPGAQLPTTTTTTTSSSSAPGSFHGRYGDTPADGNNNTTTTTTTDFASSIFGTSGISYYQSLTGQMEALNSVLEDWSRHIMMEDGDTGNSTAETDIPESQLKELPDELKNLDMSAVNAYLEQSGTKATAFKQILLNDGAVFDRNNNDSRTLTSMEDDEDNGGNNVAVVSSRKKAEPPVDVSEIPKVFFDPNFDLTDPKTFRNLLLMKDDDDETTGFEEINTDGAVHDWFPLQPQDAMGGHLDKIEEALLQQVRSNSGKFFAESQRFAQLQEWIQLLLEQVITLQSSTNHMQIDLLQPMEIVPIADSQRIDLRRLEIVLERAEDMLLCKHGLGGVLSAQDDLTAVEQIHYGRKLLNGTLLVDQDNDNESGGGGDNNNEIVELGRLHSFKAASNQLNQYEQLVVSNLRDELVEMFLSWNTTTSGSTSAYGSPHHSSTSHQEQVYARVKDIANALSSCNAASKTKEAYTTRLQDVIRMTVRTTVGEFAADVAPSGAVQSVAMGASSMSLTRFLDCLDMLFEQLLALLNSASSVDNFFVTEGLLFEDEPGGEKKVSHKEKEVLGEDESRDTAKTADSHLATVVATSSELASKSISELLRLRKEAHTLVTLEEMKSIWDSCTSFADQVDKICGTGRTSTLRSTLLAQAKAFVERRHESNMSSLAAALDSERWVQCEVSPERQAALSRLCSGRPILLSALRRSQSDEGGAAVQKSPDIEAEGTRYKVVWSCLLLVEMILNNIATSAYFSNLAVGSVSKVSELLRLFNSRSTQLVLGAGAIHSHAKLKSINAKHLSLVTQCLGMVMAILPHIRAALMAQLPKKQHTLLNGLDQIKKEYGDHNENVLNKFVSIIGGIVEINLSKTIADTDFDERAKTGQTADGHVSCCVFLEGVSTNTRKMHQVLIPLLPPDHLVDTFSRIFAFIDTKVPALLISSANSQTVFQKQDQNNRRNTQTRNQPRFTFPKTEAGKKQLLLEVESMTKTLNNLVGVRPWDFTAVNVLERALEYSLTKGATNIESSKPANPTDGENDTAENKESDANEKGTSAEENGAPNNTNGMQNKSEDPVEGEKLSNTDGEKLPNNELDKDITVKESKPEVGQDNVVEPIVPDSAADLVVTTEKVEDTATISASSSSNVIVEKETKPEEEQQPNVENGDPSSVQQQQQQKDTESIEKPPSQQQVDNGDSVPA